ncbi:hypothetical protein JOE61_001295 [Nocardioides salarius]|uniref:PH domain-containing protein n=1 Tax=Nocardioides salarius TaxID=374513 RepID=A0ABS2M8J1_9ACTN|nr:hypothetical protein [Nocardioides salarius]MBM7507481.1 hypothetical protein [Nocardioides salarius]
MRSNRQNALLTLSYVFLAVLGTGIVVAGDLAVGMFGSLLLLIAVGGFVMVGCDTYLPRHRPAVEVGTAPSGAAAMVFPYPRVALVLPVFWTAAFLIWAAAGALLFLRADAPIGVWLLGSIAALLLWPLVAVLRGRIAVGGLYLTSTGVEYRHEGISWSTSWESIASAGPIESHHSRDSLMIALTSWPERHDTTRVVWRREVRLDKPVMVVSAQYVAGGASVIADVLQRCVRLPQSRAELAQRYTVDQVNELARLGSSGSATAAP